MTEAVEVASNAVPNQHGISLEMNYVVQPSAGATGVKTATAPSGDPDAGVAQIVALTPGPYLTQPHYRWRNDDGAEQSNTVAVDVNNSPPSTPAVQSPFPTPYPAPIDCSWLESLQDVIPEVRDER